MPAEGVWTADSISYVQPRPDGAPDAWTAEARQLGKVGSQRVLEVGEVDSLAEVVPVLGPRAVLRRRLVLLDDVPVELADSYYPSALAVGTALARPEKIRGGAPTLLAALGCRPVEVVERLRVRPCSRTEADALAVELGSIVVELFRVIAGQDGLPYEVAVMVMRPEGRVFEYRLKVGADES